MNEAAWPLTSSDNTGLLAEPWERMGGGWVVMLTAYNQTDSTLMLIEVLINTAWSKETTQDVKLLLWESAYESRNGCCGSWFDWNFICSWLISNCSRWASGSNTMLAVTVCVCVCWLPKWIPSHQPKDTSAAPTVHYTMLTIKWIAILRAAGFTRLMTIRYKSSISDTSVQHMSKGTKIK